MNNTKWTQLQDSICRELSFTPPYQIKLVTNPYPEPVLKAMFGIGATGAMNVLNHFARSNGCKFDRAISVIVGN